MMTQELLKVYHDTVYRVFAPPIDIRIGSANTLLDALLERNNCLEWAFVTSANPYGKPLNQLLNFRRHEMLREKLNHYRTFEGEGLSTYDTVPSEKSFLVIGMPRNDAAKLGLLFEQNAIVVGKIYLPAELLTLT